MDNADSLYTEVTKIWYRHLMKIVMVRTQTPPTPKGVGLVAVGNRPEEEDRLDEAQEAEAVQVLNAICDMREHQPTRRPHDLAMVYHALAMLYFILSDVDKGKEFGRKALVVSEGTADDKLSRMIVEFMKLCENVQ
ncbi:hypothetical protein ScPMuIL_008592 [Solemya velum]